MKHLISAFAALAFFTFVSAGCNNDDSNPLDPVSSGNVPPNMPSAPRPAADTVITAGQHIAFLWTGGDPNAGDTVTYDLYFGTTTPATTLLAGGLTGAYYDLGIPGYGSYYWRVVAKDQKGLTTTGVNWHFTISH